MQTYTVAHLRYCIITVLLLSNRYILKPLAVYRPIQQNRQPQEPFNRIGIVHIKIFENPRLTYRNVMLFYLVTPAHPLIISRVSGH